MVSDEFYLLYALKWTFQNGQIICQKSPTTGGLCSENSIKTPAVAFGNWKGFILLIRKQELLKAAYSRDKIIFSMSKDVINCEKSNKINRPKFVKLRKKWIYFSGFDLCNGSKHNFNESQSKKGFHFFSVLRLVIFNLDNFVGVSILFLSSAK